MLNHFLMKKLASSELGIIRKIDYYVFWKSMTNSSNKEVESKIKNDFLILTLTPIDENDFNRKDYALTFAASVSKHGLIDKELLDKIINSPQLSIFSMKLVTNSIADLDHYGVDIEEETLLNLMSRTDDPSVLDDIGEIISFARSDIKNKDIILNKMIDKAGSNSLVVHSAIDAIGSSSFPIENSDKIFDRVMTRYQDKETERKIFNALIQSTSNIINREKLLNSILNRPGLNNDDLDWMLTNLKLVDDLSESHISILDKIIKSKASDIMTIMKSAGVIRESSSPPAGSEKILRHIWSLESKSKDLSKTVAFTLINSISKIPGSQELLKDILNSPALTQETLDYVIQEIDSAEMLDSKDEIKLLAQKRLKELKN